MALDSFNWCVQTQNSGGSMTSTNNVRMVSYGNGYQQRGSQGFNTFRRSFTINYIETDWADVYEFIIGHLITPFYFLPPDNKPGLFVVKADSITLTPTGKANLNYVGATFEEVFTSMQ